MRLIRVSVAIVVSTLLLGCRHADPESGPGSAFEPLGGVFYRGRSATFSADRIVGPEVDLIRRADGSWGGRMHGHTVDVDEYPGRIAGTNLKLSVQQSTQGLILAGLWLEEMVRFEITPQKLTIRTPKYALTLQATGPGTYGQDGLVRLTGGAAQLAPRMPQFALALAGAFLDADVGRRKEALQEVEASGRPSYSR
jgi:hypothetical protein